MESSTRRAFRKSEKSGVTVEEAAAEGFATSLEHLLDVFAKQQLRPTYDRDGSSGWCDTCIRAAISCC